MSRHSAIPLGTILVAFLLAACADPPNPSPTDDAGVDTGATGSATHGRTLAIYAAVIRSTAETEGWYGAIHVYDRICPHGIAGGSDDRCLRSYTLEEQAQLSAALEDLPRFAWISDPRSVVEEDSGVQHGGAVITVGPIEGSGDRVEVHASAYCGNVCGHFLTRVVERTDEDWGVSRTTGGIGIA